VKNKASMTTATSDEVIDVVKVFPDKYKILFENESVRIVENILKPGEKDNVHNHPIKTEYVISGGTIRVYPENVHPVDYEEQAGIVFLGGENNKVLC
jgi:hypothetical protein